MSAARGTALGWPAAICCEGRLGEVHSHRPAHRRPAGACRRVQLLGLRFWGVFVQARSAGIVRLALVLSGEGQVRAGGLSAGAICPPANSSLPPLPAAPTAITLSYGRLARANCPS